MKRFKVLIVGLVLLCCHSAAFAQTIFDWPMFGRNPQNTATNPTEILISPYTANYLRMRWAFTTGGDVSARAAVVNGIVYFPDWGGYLWALGALNGHKLWAHQLSDYGLPANTHSRTTPAVVN